MTRARSSGYTLFKFHIYFFFKLRWTIICSVCLFAFSAHGNTTPKKKGCVVGTGGAGLAMIKEFAAHPDDFEPIGFERNSDVGGLWIYTDSTDVDQHGLPVHSNVYKSMRTTFPKQLMHFDDFRPFGGENRSCAKHETVLEYLRNYTEHFDLRQYIKFDTLVERVTPILGDGDWRTTKWRVQTRDLTANRIDTTICDAVIICSGRDRKPIIPKIPGMETFPGRIIHSRSYRTPESFANQTVVVLGVGPSGVDIAMDLSSHAKKIYLSHRGDKIKSEWPDNVEQVRGVVSANGNEFTLQDNSSIIADTFIFCTGYALDFPTIDESSSGIVVETKRVHPLYKHMVNARHPSMGIFGLPFGYVLHFSIFYVQAKYYVALLRGEFELPSLEDRLKDAKLPPGVPTGKAHKLECQWEYYEELADAAGFKTLADYYKEGLNVWLANMLVDTAHFKESELECRNGEFEITYPRGRGEFFHE